MTSSPGFGITALDRQNARVCAGLLPLKNGGMGLWAALCAQPQRGADLGPYHGIRHRTTVVRQFRYRRQQPPEHRRLREHNDFHGAPLYAMPSRTQPLDFGSIRPTRFSPTGNSIFATETLQYHVSDEIELGMTQVDLGLKGFRSNKAMP